MSGDGSTVLVSGSERIVLSTDRGRSWEETGPEREYAQSCISEDGCRMAVGALGSELLYSDDAGESWRDISDIGRESGIIYVACTPTLSQLFIANWGDGAYVGSIDNLY